MGLGLVRVCVCANPPSVINFHPVATVNNAEPPLASDADLSRRVWEQSGVRPERDNASGPTALLVPERPVEPVTASWPEAVDRVACFHCGEPCPDAGLTREGKSFCCHGCLTVHDLLAENGLGQFYELNAHPGTKVRADAGTTKWAYLDEPSLQPRLLDFSDGRTGKVTLALPAIHCIACVWLLESLFRLHPGIGNSRVNYARREATITFQHSRIKLSKLASLLTSIGYEPSLTLQHLEKRREDAARKRLHLQIGVAGFAFGNIMLFSLPGYFGLDTFSGPLFHSLFGVLSLLLALPVLVYSAADYFRSALLSVRQRLLVLEVPIALGLIALFGQSAREILAGTGAGYLDSLAGLVFFLLCGRLFQQKTHARLAFDRDYRCFFPLAVTRKVSAGEETVAISQLRTGDRLVLRNGEMIPADARLIQGPAFIDYSFVTGESEPVSRQEGEYLYAGGRQVGSAIELETVKPVSQSYLASLWNHETFRKADSRDLSSLTNRFSRVFTPLVICIAACAAIFWAFNDPTRALKAGTAVLIVACPCALALAAPFALGTAQRWLARFDVFLKNPLVVERLAEIDTVIFDKTGTLTAPKSSRIAFSGSPLETREESWIFSLTRLSIHPYSVRISEALADRHFPEPVLSYLETPGAGIEGQVQGREIWLGSGAWLASRGVEIPSVPKAHGAVVFVAIDGRYRGFYSLRAEVRPDTDRLLQALARDRELALLSGDNNQEEERFRALFGPEAKLQFNRSPVEKLEFIQSLQSRGRKTMMVGDGLNDAGALKQSEVGVAVVEQVGAFSPASDVIMAASRVPRLADVLAYSRSVTRVVRWSFGLSALYNLVGLSFAAAGLLSPVICAILMPLSSISVVLFASGATTWMARRKRIFLTQNKPVQPTR